MIKAAHDQYYAIFMEQAWQRILYNEQREALLERERELIESPDPEFRFHSGLPVT